MSEELRIEVDVKTEDTKARSQLDSLIKEYNKKSIDLDVKLGKLDIDNIQRSIKKVTNDLEIISNIKFDNLNKLETSLKKINKLLENQKANSSINGTNYGALENEYAQIDRLVGSKEESLKKIQELEQIGEKLKVSFENYSTANKEAFSSLEQDGKTMKKVIQEIAQAEGYVSDDFEKALKQRMKLVDIAKKLEGLDVSQIQSGTIKGQKYDGTMVVNTTNPFVSNIKRTLEEEERVLEEARKLGVARSQANSKLNKILDNLSSEEKTMLEKLTRRYDESTLSIKDYSGKSESLESEMTTLLKNSLPDFDKLGLDFEKSGTFLEGYKRFFNSIDEMKDEFTRKFGASSGTAELDIFGGVEKTFKSLDNTIESLNLSNLKEKISKAFDFDDKIMVNIDKLESALKQLNSMNSLTQKSLFEGKSVGDLQLDSKIKEYLDLDKKINSSFTKLEKAQLQGHQSTAKAIENEIELLYKKRDAVNQDLKNSGSMTLKLREQIDMQTKLNSAIAETEQASFKESFITKAHQEALKLNQEFDEMVAKQKKIADFKQQDIIDTKDLKSMVEYLDSAEDGIKRIITTSKGIGKDLTTTLYGDGTQVRKQVTNVEKIVNDLSVAYRQADTELTRLLKSQQQLFSAGDYKTASVLEGQINKWKEIKSNVENAAKSVNVYEAMVAKVNNTLLKNKNGLETDASKLQVKIDIDNQKAIAKFEEFKTKALSNIQEIERKYQGTELFGNAKAEASELINKLNQMETSLKEVDRIDLSNLTSDMREFNQAMTQSKRDLNDLNRNMSRGFFSNFGEEFKSNLMTFTAGELLADGVRSVASSLKEIVMEYDTAFANLKKVADPKDIMHVDQLDAIGQKAVQIAKNVGTASQDVIQAIGDTIQMGGYSMEQATVIAEQTMMLANVAEMTQEAASQGVVTMLSAFKLDPLKETSVVVKGMTQNTTELTNAMDKLNYVGNNFAVSSDGLLDAIQNGANVLADYGVSMNDVVALITGANKTLQNTNKVGNGLKSIGINLAGVKANAKDGSVELNKTALALKEIAGIEVYSDKSKGEIKDMMTLLDEVKGKWASLSDEQRKGLSEAIAGM